MRASHILKVLVLGVGNGGFGDFSRIRAKKTWVGRGEVPLTADTKALRKHSVSVLEHWITKLGSTLVLSSVYPKYEFPTTYGNRPCTLQIWTICFIKKQK